MKICSKCGFRDNPFWRSSRFEINADYMRYEDFEREFFPLKGLFQDQYYVYYRRGKGGLYVYRVPIEDFKVHRERKKH